MDDAFKLSPPEWARLRELLDEALALPPADRLSWIDALDEVRHAQLKPRLRRLLTHAADASTDPPATVGRLLDTLPKVETNQFAPPPQDTATPPERVGPYRLLRELGSGGMASVWLAERTDMLQGRQVALKLPHGAWRRAGLHERLAREREILATLEHPNIARLYDAGVADGGQPYLALEYAEGERLDAWCERRALDVPARLRLFLQVTRAVAYAHAQLVVHRDLKPSNILVTADGQAKLLDFGIAKLLDQGQAEETELTQQSGRAMTPDYAAPEQILGQPIGTSADVYALGVVLFELLTGRRPYQLKRDTRAALEEAILHADVPRPSSVAPAARARALRGDLDTIVLKGLKKAPSDRYATVAALAEDVELHLQQRPVLAQPDSVTYRAAKFVRRNRMAVMATATVSLAVLGGAGVAMWQAVQARAERDEAVLQQRRAVAYSDFLRVLLQDAGRPDQPVTPTQLLDRGALLLQRRAGRDDLQAAHMWFELSRHYLLFQNTEQELALLDRSIEAARHTDDLNQLAASQCAAAWSQMVRDREKAHARLLAGRQALAGTRFRTEVAERECARAEARWLLFTGKTAESIALLEQTRQRLADHRDRGSSGGDYLRSTLADHYLIADRPQDALPLLEQNLEEMRQAGRQGSLGELVAQHAVAGTLTRLGEFRRSAERYEDLIAWARQPELAAALPSGMLSFASTPLLRLGKFERVLLLVEIDLPLAQRSGNPVTLAISHLTLARARIGVDRLDQASVALDDAQASLSARNPGHARLLQEVAMSRAEIALLRGDADTARQSVSGLLETLGYPASLNAPGIDRLLRLAARIELKSGDAQRAEGFATDALQTARRLARSDDSNADTGIARLLRAEALMMQRRAAEARVELQRSLPALDDGLGPEHAESRRARVLLRSLGE